MEDRTLVSAAAPSGGQIMKKCPEGPGPVTCSPYFTDKAKLSQSILLLFLIYDEVLILSSDISIRNIILKPVCEMHPRLEMRFSQAEFEWPLQLWQ